MAELVRFVNLKKKEEGGKYMSGIVREHLRSCDTHTHTHTQYLPPYQLYSNYRVRLDWGKILLRSGGDAMGKIVDVSIFWLNCRCSADLIAVPWAQAGILLRGLSYRHTTVSIGQSYYYVSMLLLSIIHSHTHAHTHTNTLSPSHTYTISLSPTRMFVYLIIIFVYFQA